ncbi:hypothetical protein [Streptomyces noursei]|uniref:hypothetical protein n=1 Tax=Streptomyces noursei TaxID=1971 RepID=UPI0011AF4492|nr:hypothetical protein [Streptomyces noursei]
MTAEEAEEAAYARISKDATGSNPSAFRNLVEDVHKASQALERSGALYAGTCVRTSDDRLSLGTLLVTVTPFEFGDATVAANGIVRSLTSGPGESWTGSAFDTPNGPMAVASGIKLLQLPAQASPLNEELELPVAEMQAYLPVPQGSESQQQCLVCIDFTTPCEEHWGEHCNDLVNLTRSITFDEPPSIPLDTSTQTERATADASAPPASSAGTPHAESEGPATPFG